MLFQKKYGHITPDEVKRKLDSGDDMILLDVRTPAEYAQRHIKGSISLPLNELRQRYAKMLPDPAKTIVIYCLSGARSAQAASELASLGYKNVSNMGGITSWPYETE